MPWDVEFLPVGDGQSAGDAIVVSYDHRADGGCQLAVIDGGTKDSGQALVEHVRRWFPRVPLISHVVSTHPGNDHASGLREVLDALPVANLWMHRPWLYSERMLERGLFEAGWSVSRLNATIRREYTQPPKLHANSFRPSGRTLPASPT